MRSTTASGCSRMEEAISARIDGEEPGMDPAVVDAHLARCDACRAFERNAAAGHRRFRVRTAGDVPDLSARILAAVPDGRPPRARRGRTLGLPQLGAVAALVAVVVVAGYLVGTRVGGTSSSTAAGGQLPLANIQQVVGSTQASPLYPGATVLPPRATEPKPDVTLTDTSGQPYDMASATAGRITLLYFGYTHCPDICPTVMADTAEAIHGLPADEKGDVSVVFVTTDPSRDSPPVIKHWLGEFTNAFSDPAFIGLTGSVALIHDAERQIDMPLSRATTNGDVVHAGYVLAYADDGIAHLLIDDTESPTDYTATLHSLITKGFRSA